MQPHRWTPSDARTTVSTLADLAREGVTKDVVRSQVRAHRWQRVGRAVVRHNAAPSAAERERIALITHGPRAVLTSFTALAAWGLEGWVRDEIHILVPRGARVPRIAGLPVRVHYTDRWGRQPIAAARGAHRPGPAALLAAASFRQPRVASAILAAAVQQRLARPDEFVALLGDEPRIRHRAQLLAAAHDISQGAQALSEIDFVRLCRRAGLPEPSRQAVRTDPSGRRRYLDAAWDRVGRRPLSVEVDGALHLAAARWWKDQLRQNELVILGDRILRFPSVVVRCEERLVADQLRRGLDAA